MGFVIVFFHTMFNPYLAMPHKSVDHKLFYRHIPTAYPDPIKTRMLLVWCTNRAIDENLKRSSAIRKGKGKQKEVMTEEGDRMLREVMEEFVQGMNRGSVDTNTYALPVNYSSQGDLKYTDSITVGARKCFFLWITTTSSQCSEPKSGSGNDKCDQKVRTIQSFISGKILALTLVTDIRKKVHNGLPSSTRQTTSSKKPYVSWKKR